MPPQGVVMPPLGAVMPLPGALLPSLPLLGALLPSLPLPEGFLMVSGVAGDAPEFRIRTVSIATCCDLYEFERTDLTPLRYVPLHRGGDADAAAGGLGAAGVVGAAGADVGRLVDEPNELLRKN